jgi:hypothetical protein
MNVTAVLRRCGLVGLALAVLALCAAGAFAGVRILLAASYGASRATLNSGRIRIDITCGQAARARREPAASPMSISGGDR